MCASSVLQTTNSPVGNDPIKIKHVYTLREDL